MRSAGSGSNREKHPPDEYGYTVVYQRMPEGGYSVVVPAIPEICTFGETLPEARRMAKDAVRCFLEGALKTGEAIPEHEIAPTQPQIPRGGRCAR
jgi:predicted RNase H-like HicB family nuclease